MAVVGHTRIAERADEDRVERSQRVVAVRRNRFARGEIVIGAPRQVMQIDATDCLEDLDRLGDHLFADAVAGNDRDSMRHERILAASEACMSPTQAARDCRSLRKPT